MTTAGLFENAPQGATELAVDAVLGVDPGLGGGLALLDGDGRVLGCWDTPAFKIGKGERREYERTECLELVRSAAALRPGVALVLEELRPFPPQAGRGSSTTANFKLGIGVELWRMAAIAVGIRFEAIPPKTWQKVIGVHPGGDAHLARAREMYPREELHLKKHSGRAAALLIAEAGRRTLIRPAGGDW